MLKSLCSTNDKEKNNDLVIVIKSRLSDLKKEIDNMSEEENKIEKPNEIIDIFEKPFLSLMIEPKLLFSFYRSKKLTKTIYNHLINTI